MSWIYGRNQSAVLFVHSDNQPAHRLYYGLDFSDEGEYEIVYTKLD
jgi:predicted GNAT family acetyltransferase